MSKQNTPCVPARMTRPRGGKQIGDYCGGTGGMRQAREELTRREGPPPFPGAVCRHLPECENDSMAPNGFVCTLHTTWGTAAENLMDQGLEPRKRGGRVGGAVSGRIVTAQPDNANKLQVTCPYCGKTGQKLVMARWHFNNCKWRS
jgi:hypothetical protein